LLPVVLDTNVVLPALLSPGGLARKFWLLLALGALTARAEDARLEREAVEGEARALGATIGGRALNELAMEAEAKRARLADRLPRLLGRRRRLRSRGHPSLHA
jgi:hypothetical protein